MMDRVIWIVLDSVGMGELPDADQYGDQGSNTLGNTAKAVGGLHIPNMVKLGLGNIEGMQNIDMTERPIGCFGRFGEKSAGKDTTTGHWEMAGVISEQAFPTYPNGFPEEIMRPYHEKIGTKTLGNKVASGTAILDELGEEHMKTGYPIIYTSADSVFQIAAHEEVIPVERLYELCKIARELLVEEHAVARVIARPFIGAPGRFNRTPNRRDFSLYPPYDTVLDKVKDKGLHVMAVGKIEDIFTGQGITEAIHTVDNMDGVEKTLDYMRTEKKGIIFTNLVDFDMKWGHRNDAPAYAKGLEDFDHRLSEILQAMKETDVLFITADHGCDPTTPSTDHSREYVPFLAYGKGLLQNVDLRTRETFADIGQTIGEILQVEPIQNGTSFLSQIRR